MPVPLPRANATVEGVADADLVKRALEGAGWAFGALYRRHVTTVGNVVARLLASRQDVNDVVHDVFVAAFEKLATLRDRSAFRAWLLQIAVSHARQVLRRRRFRRTLSLDSTVEDATLELLASEPSTAEARAELGRIDTALRKVSVDERLAWMLRNVEGYALADVAQACECSVSTVKRRVEVAQAVVDRYRRSGWST